jgi:hypothetical protein
MQSYILIHLVCQSVTGLGKGVLCSRELSTVGRMVAADSKDRARGIDRLKNRSGKCEGPGEGGFDGVKNRSGKCEGPGQRGGTNGCLKRKVFLKNQKHQPNIVEITHLCIMHGVHTNLYCFMPLVLSQLFQKKFI